MSKLQEYLLQNGLAIDEAKLATRLGIHDYMRQARDSNKAYLALADPGASDRNAQITKLTRQNNRIMKLLLNDMTEEADA